MVDRRAGCLDHLRDVVGAMIGEAVKMRGVSVCFLALLLAGCAGRGCYAAALAQFEATDRAFEGSPRQSKIAPQLRALAWCLPPR